MPLSADDRRITSKKAPSWLARLQSGWLGPLMRTPIAIFNQFWENVNHFARTNYELGCEQIDRGNLRDAIFRFRVAIWAEPTHYLAWYHLGCCYLALGKNARALVALRRALRLNPKSQEARFMLFALDAKALPREQMPTTMPRAILLNQFEDEATGYETLHVNQLGYSGHIALAAAVRRELEPSRNDYAVLDLGCGTGLVGSQLGPIASLLIGVDLSPPMARIAGEALDASGRKIYDDVHISDLREFLEKITDPAYDIITAATVFSYVGDLTPIFDGVTRALRPGGIFAFTADIAETATGYQILTKLARFAHSEAYLRGQAARVGLTEIGISRIMAYPEYPMLQCLFRKP